MSIKYFEDLEIWKIARELTQRIYKITSNGKFSKDYGLCDQIRRASVSVMSNIAEGFERGGNQELLQFLSIAKGSSGEVRAQLYVALDQGYIARNEAEKLIDEFRKLSIMINNFMEYLKGSRYRGKKYRIKYKSMKEEVEDFLKEYEKKKENN